MTTAETHLDLATLAFAKRVKSAVLSVEPEAQVILFGSRARGDWNEDSDWDFFVLTDRKDKWQLDRLLMKPIYQLMLEADEFIQFIQFPKSDWKAGRTPNFLVRNIREEGILL